ncbi:uncharacterized protein LOC118433406 [Folsomia candida]|uniref:uncharacterized protein LOC118433406 n=1 Tax=Folsomia candida TaxID=158441 RepID=UPI0016051FE1|nr:uncharacterized protein LOC118433406 [Folsomia candida]
MSVFNLPDLTQLTLRITPDGDAATQPEVIPLSDHDLSNMSHHQDEVLQFCNGISFSVVTYNISHANKPARPSAAQKKHLLTAIFSDLPADTYFLQECSWTDIAKHIATIQLKYKFRWIKSYQQLILFNSKKFTGISLQATIPNIAVDVPRDRFCVLKLTHKNAPNFDFIAISWHADRFGKLNVSFFKFVDGLVDTEKIPALVGGDFNYTKLKTYEDKNVGRFHYSLDIGEEFHVKLKNVFYKPTQHCVRGSSIDFLVSTFGPWPLLLGLHSAQELSLRGDVMGERFNLAARSLTNIAPSNVTDHVPVYGYVNCFQMLQDGIAQM